MYKNSFIVFCVFVLIACTSKYSPLEEALELSGTNRKELEKVLSLYSQSESDSLKLRAAVFLIENMPGHYTLTNGLMDKYIRTMDSLYPDMSSIVKRVVYNIPLRNQRQLGNLKKVEDITVIKSDFLIQHIDNAIQMWDSCFWLRDLTFDDFCEYVLPYKVSHEPLLANDSTLHLWKEALRGMEYYNFTPKSLVDIKSLQHDMLGHSDDIYFHGIKTPSLSSRSYIFDCLDVCYYEISRVRMIGLPSAIDFVPGWPDRNGRHYWRVTIDPAFLNNINGDLMRPQTAKIYRMTYSHNPIPIPNGRDSIPALFCDPFIRDVTKQYLKVSDVEVKMSPSVASAPDYMYLSIFNDLEWRPMAWASIKRGKALFRNMKGGIVYLPVFYKGEEEICADYPFFLSTKGDIRKFIPDKNHLITIKMNRKYPLIFPKLEWGESLKGCYIEASNCPDFKDVDTLYKIDRPNPSLNYTAISLKQPATYRYWRISKAGSTICIGDWQLLDGEGNRIIGKAMSGKENDKSVDKAFDDDILTFSSSPSWLGIDLGRKVDIKTMKFVPRTDGNGVTAGHTYELLYYSEEGWESLGFKCATSDFVEFKSVPTGALYWLRDDTDGREERIFSYENGHAIFW